MRGFIPTNWKEIQKIKKSKRLFVKVSLFFVLILAITLWGLKMKVTEASVPWYNAGWSKRNLIIINSIMVGNGVEDEDNFPVEILVSGLSGVNAGGTDIRFTADDGVTPLAREIESYSSGTLVAWVKIPHLSHTTNTSIYLYYGNPAATEPTPSSTYGSQNVWTNGYAGVWHLGDINNPIDSTVNSNNGTNHSATSANGQIAGAGNFDGSSAAYVGVTNNGSLNINNNITMSAWVFIPSYPPSTGQILSNNDNSGYRYRVSAAGYVSFFDRGGTNSLSSLHAIPLNTWTYVTATGDSSGLNIYLNGSSDNSNTVAFGGGTGGTVSIGKRAPTNAEYFNGILDDVRVSSVTRSPGWIATEYNNQNAPASFYTVEGLEILTVPGAPTGVSAMPGDSQAAVSFTAPASDGNSPITSYTVTSNPGNITATGATSPIVVTGLDNNTPYTFTVRATNILGTGSASVASNIAIPYGTPPAGSYPIRGAAWWGDQYQYLYFDCLDDVTGDRLDVNGNLYAPPVPYGFHLYVPPCTNIVHHTYINNNGNLSGTAWNYSKGFVTFDATSTPPDGFGFNSKCPHTCNLSNNCSACYNESEQKVYGWARVINGGEWIRLDSAATTPVALQSWDYENNSVLPGHGVMPGDFVGDATSPSGNLSFNCQSEGGGAGNCVTRNYKVYVSGLRVGHLSAPNWTYSQACTDSALKAVLKWYLNSGTQAGYEIVVNTTDHFSTSTADYVCWSGIKTPGVATQYIIPNSDPNCGALTYNTNYYWWIRLFESDGSGGYKPTQWYQFGAYDGHNGFNDERTDGNPDNNMKTFTTYRHEFPNPYFTWSPFDVIVGTSTDFISSAKYYNSGAPNTPQNCLGGVCSYLWSASDVDSLIGASSNSTTSIIFYHATGTDVTLTVTDPDNYTCSSSTPLNINYNLPIWREVKAQ